MKLQYFGAKSRIMLQDIIKKETSMLHQKKDGNTRAGRGHHAVRRVLLLVLLTAVLLAVFAAAFNTLAAATYRKRA